MASDEGDFNGVRGIRLVDVSGNRATFFTPVLDVVHQRIDPRREDVGVGQQVRVDVELT